MFDNLSYFNFSLFANVEKASYLYFLLVTEGRRPWVESPRGVYDPPESFSNCRGCLEPPAIVRRVFCHLGGRRRRSEGQPLYRRHLRHPLALA